MKRALIRTKVLRPRLKDKHAKSLRDLAGEVNFVWNCNELQSTMFNRERRFLSGYDFAGFTRGATKEGLHLHSQTVQAIAEEYATRRRQSEKVRLSWYLNACVAVPFAERRSKARRDVGIDLGLEDLLATSAGEKMSAPQFYRRLEPKLAIAQRAGKKHRVRAIHAKIANRRRDFLHQFSTSLIRRYDAIFVGNVSAAALTKTPHAKSVLDAGWSALRTMLRYKCDFAGATFAAVNEAFSTQACSACDSRSGPKGIAGLGIREWTCSECGTVHDRNVNAARVILAAGRRRLAEGISALEGGSRGRQSRSIKKCPSVPKAVPVG